MTRPSHFPSDIVDQALANLGRTTIILVGVSEYEELENLNGPSSDMEMIASILIEDPFISLYQETQVIELENPSSSDFRTAISEYAQGRSAHGDILVLYFTGHGCVLPGGSFGFCFRDSKLGFEGRGLIPLTIVSFEDVINTLTSYDVHPAFIIDACFSGSTAPHGHAQVSNVMEEMIKSATAESYALLASSSSFSPSLDTPDGGAFTQSLYTIIFNGLPEATGRYSPFITIDQLAGPLQDDLSKLGLPLSKCYVGRDFPILPMAKNQTFHPQSESFTPYMKRIIELLWNNGSPIEIQISIFNTAIGPGAYANHSKLSRSPWALLEDGESNSVRRLTSRGKRFAAGKLRIPKKIVKNPFNREWIAADDTDLIRIDLT